MTVDGFWDAGNISGSINSNVRGHNGRGVLWKKEILKSVCKLKGGKSIFK